MFFRVDNEELWMTDGSLGGTSKLADDGQVTGITRETLGLTLFQVTTDTARQVWRTDGTVEGTFKIANGRLTQLDFVATEVAWFKTSIGTNTLQWKTDGTIAGTVRAPLPQAPTLSATGKLRDSQGNLLMSFDNAFEPFEFAGKLYFFVFEDFGAEEPGALMTRSGEGSVAMTPWVSDGTASGTVPLSNQPIKAPWRIEGTPSIFNPPNTLVGFKWIGDADGRVLFQRFGSSTLEYGTAVQTFSVDGSTGTIAQIDLAHPIQETTKTQQGTILRNEQGCGIGCNGNTVRYWRTDGLDTELVFSAQDVFVTLAEAGNDTLVFTQDDINFNRVRRTFLTEDGESYAFSFDPLLGGDHWRFWTENDSVVGIFGQQPAPHPAFLAPTPRGLYWNGEFIDYGSPNEDNFGISELPEVLSSSPAGVLYTRGGSNDGVWGVGREHTSPANLEFLRMEDVSSAVEDDFGHYFFRGAADDRRLWASDGTVEGTGPVGYPESPSEASLIEWSDGRTLVIADDPVLGQEIFTIEVTEDNLTGHGLIRGSATDRFISVKAISLPDETSQNIGQTFETRSPSSTFSLEVPPGNYRVVVSCLLYTSPSPRDKRQSRMPSSA